MINGTLESVGMAVTGTVVGGGLTVTGTVHDLNDSTVWIETSEDIYLCPMNTVEAVTAAPTALINESPRDARTDQLTEWLLGQDIQPDLTENDDCFDVTFELDAYIMSVYVYDGHYEYNTVSKAKMEREAAKMPWEQEYVEHANQTTVKKFATLTKHIERLADKW